ncbi:MAG: type II toxin-antitoxin system VapC family toxin [Gemmataceae bacterium]
MKARTFLDTLFVIALINQRDQYHERAAELAARYEGERFLTTDAVLLEIGNALAKKYRQEAVEAITHLLTSEDVEVVRLTAALFDESFALYKSHRDKEWGLIDCISFVVMRQNDIQEALTFDRHFVQAGIRALMRDAE